MSAFGMKPTILAFASMSASDPYRTLRQFKRDCGLNRTPKGIAEKALSAKPSLTAELNRSLTRRSQSAAMGLTAEQHNDASWEVALDKLADRFGANVVDRANDLNELPGMRLGRPLISLDDGTLD
jgi:hypothetical protein